MRKCRVDKKNQLGIDPGTAAHQLKKLILFDLLKQLKKNYCYQCASEIETPEELSIEHKTPWLHSNDPKGLFFDLSNIAFSHLSCNVGAARRAVEAVHPSATYYAKGCRCSKCKEIVKLDRRRQRNETTGL